MNYAYMYKQFYTLVFIAVAGLHCHDIHDHMYVRKCSVQLKTMFSEHLNNRTERNGTERNENTCKLHKLL